MASTISQFSAFIKAYFNPSKVEDLTKSGKPFLGKIRKNEDISGDPWTVPILYVNPQGLAAVSLATAQTNASNVKGDKWLITVGNYFASVSIGDRVMMATRNNAGAFLENKATEIEGLYESVSNQIAMYLWRNGGGATGQIAIGGISGNVLTLADASQAFNFEFNETIVACSDDGTNTGTTPRTGSTTVTSVDRANGKITVANAASITSLTAGDFLFRGGDVVANTGALLMHGVQAYITANDSPGTLWGVTRTTDIQRLSGCRVPSTILGGKGIEERIQLLGAYMAGRFRAFAGAGDFEIYLHPEDGQTLNISLQSRGIRQLTDESTSFGYKYWEVIAGGIGMKLFTDPYVPKGSIFILKMKNWVLGSYGPLISNVKGDGLELLRNSTTNDYEYRLKGYPEVACEAPGFSGFIAAP